MALNNQAYEHLAGFTPVRRPEHILPYVSPSNSTQIAWTTSRCNRLLRPISATLAALRKRKQERLARTSVTAQAVLQTSNLNTASLGDTRTSKPGLGGLADNGLLKENTQRDDPDWVPDDGPRKRLKRTYSSKCASYPQRAPSHPNASCDGSTRSFRRATFATAVPFTRINHVPFIEATRPKQSTSRAASWEISPYNSLYVGLGALLIATRSTQSKVYGASSLFSSCLRRLPEYALQEQRDVKAEEPETLSDVPTELYEELHEIFGSASGGWKPLRMLVRWHAIALLREAILDNVIDFETVGRLIEICELEGAFAEQAQLQNAFLASTWPGDSEVSASIASCFRMHRRDVSYRQMTARLLDTGKPFRWISHNWILPLVHQAVTDVVHESTQVGSHAGSALVAAIMRSIGFCELKISPENRSEERPVKVSKKVRSKIDKDSSKQARRWLRGSEMVAYREDTVEVSTTGAFVELLADIVSGVLAVRGLSKARLTKTLVELEVVTRRAAMLYTRREEKYVQKRSELIRLSLLLLIMVMLPARSEHSSEVSQFSSSLELLSGMCIDPESELLMAKLLTTIASKTDQWTGKCDAFKHLDAMIQGLLKNASRSNDLTVKSMIHRVILDAAFQFADCSKMREHMDWALELEEYLDSVVSITRQLDSQTPLRHSHSRATGFRWKATLGEWVPKTPGSAKLQNTATRTSSTGAPGQQRIASDSTRESSVVSDVSTTPTSVKSPINRHPDHKCAEGFTKIPPHSVQIVIYRPANVSAGRRHSAPIFTSGSCKTSPVSSPAKAEKRKHESTSDVSYNQISRVISICIHSKDTVWEERDCVRQKHEEKDELACETTPASQRVSQIQRSSSTMGIPIKSDTIRQYNLRGRRSTEIVVKEFDMEIRDYCNRACQKLQMRPGQRSGINLPDEMIYDDNEYSEDELGF